jgi:hypothetical protein
VCRLEKRVKLYTIVNPALQDVNGRKQTTEAATGRETRKRGLDGPNASRWIKDGRVQEWAF